MTGQLFTHYFLTDGIKATAEWPASAAYYDAFRQSLAQAYETFRQHHQPNEALTEQDLIRPALELLGWTDYLPQQGSPTATRISPTTCSSPTPNPRPSAPALSDPEGPATGHASVVEESKRFGLRLDARDNGDRVQVDPPQADVKASQHAPRPDPPLPFDRRHRVRRPDSLGHSD